MNWFLVMTAMLSALKTDENLSGIGIQAGALVPVPTEPEVRLIRGPSQPKTNEPGSVNELTIWVECWEVDEEAIDPMIGYQKLADLEGRVITAINRFGAGDQRIDGKQIRVRPGRAEPDGDIFRPMVGSRTAVAISWQ